MTGTGHAIAGPVVVTAIATGWNHTCGLTSAGGVKCWGLNHVGQLGDGTNTTRTRPVDVSRLSTGVTAIAAGGNHTCALTSLGGVWCWGGNHYGGLGDGSTTDRWAPVDVAGLSSGVSAIAVGAFHTCAITASGAVKCWGSNDYGQVGDGSGADQVIPVDVSGATSGARAVTAGGQHTCAVMANHALKCWGDNQWGQVGDGTTMERPTPVDVVGLAAPVTMPTAGGRHSCAVASGGTLKCWGYNVNGQLGDNSVTDRHSPVDVVDQTLGMSPAAGRWHTCERTSGGAVRCWGSGAAFGEGSSAVMSPRDVAGLVAGVIAVASGEQHTCAALASGAVKCLGQNADGQLGNGTTASSPQPVDVLFGGGSVVADFDGSGTTDVAVFRPSSATWFVQGGPAAAWGTDGDVPVPGDYDGDGTADMAVFRPSFGAWYVRGGATAQWGTYGDIPVPGDYDGNGTTDMAVFRPSTGAWYVHGGGATQWGVSGDTPVPADYDGNGTTDIAVFRPSSGTWFVLGGAPLSWGISSDVPVPGDYDGDGTSDVAILRPSSGTWFVRNGVTTNWGASGDNPAPGDYDGDGTTDLAVYRPPSGTWFVHNGVTAAWGVSSDVVVALPAAVRQSHLE